MPKLIPVLNPPEVQTLLEKIFELRRFWSKRSENFFTLGTALYLDRKNPSVDSYAASLESMNYFMHLHFVALYERLKDVLQKELKQKVEFESSLALPGFHIFLASPDFVGKGGSIHFDLQYQQANWDQYQKVDLDHPLSFTLALALPRLGGGLFHWDKLFDPQIPFNIEEEAQKMTRHYFPYEVGKLALHDGKLLHQIAPAQEYFEEDKRITLQGHALFCDGCWRLYW